MPVEAMPVAYAAQILPTRRQQLVQNRARNWKRLFKSCSQLPRNLAHRDLHLWMLGGILQVRQTMYRADRGNLSADSGSLDILYRTLQQETGHCGGRGRQCVAAALPTVADEFEHVRSVGTQGVGGVGSV